MTLFYLIKYSTIYYNLKINKYNKIIYFKIDTTFFDIQKPKFFLISFYLTIHF